jgi:hypothetical protein
MQRCLQRALLLSTHGSMAVDMLQIMHVVPMGRVTCRFRNFLNTI